MLMFADMLTAISSWPPSEDTVAADATTKCPGELTRPPDAGEAGFLLLLGQLWVMQSRFESLIPSHSPSPICPEK